MCPLTADLIAVASRASHGAGTLMGGVDIGEDTETGDLVVYEVNSCPSLEPAVLGEAASFLAAATRMSIRSGTATRTCFTQVSKIYSAPTGDRHARHPDCDSRPCRLLSSGHTPPVHRKCLQTQVPLATGSAT